MLKSGMLAVAVLFFSCSVFGPKDSAAPSTTFSLKLINTGKYAVTGFYLNPSNDSVTWGQNVLPASSLDSNEFVFINNFAKGSDYAMRARFDSAGTVTYLIFTHISLGPDTITAHASLGDFGYSIGYEWGLQHWPGEHPAN
jgi:hypothetical protein